MKPKLVKIVLKLLKDLYHWLRRRGLGERTLKTALAVTLAWLIGKIVPGGTDHPYFDPLTAIFSMQTTVADSITGAIQRVLGIVSGAAVALAVSSLLGESAWGIGLMVLVALLLGTNLRLTSQGVSEVATSALLVMFFGNASSLAYAGSRLVECSVGAIVGVAVNALLFPPNQLEQARATARALTQAITTTLEHLAVSARTGLNREGALQNLNEGRALSTQLAAAQLVLAQAESSLKYNLLGRAQQAQLLRYQHLIETLEHLVIQVRGMTRTLLDILEGEAQAEAAAGTTPPPSHLNLAVPGELNETLATLFTTLSRAVIHFVENESSSKEVANQVSQELGLAFSETEQSRRMVYQAATGQHPPLSAEGWMQLGALLSDADRLLADLTVAISPELRTTA